MNYGTFVRWDVRATMSFALTILDVTTFLLCLLPSILLDNIEKWGLVEIVITIGNILRTCMMQHKFKAWYPYYNK